MSFFCSSRDHQRGKNEVICKISDEFLRIEISDYSNVQEVCERILFIKKIDFARFTVSILEEIISKDTILEDKSLIEVNFLPNCVDIMEYQFDDIRYIKFYSTKLLINCERKVILIGETETKSFSKPKVKTQLNNTENVIIMNYTKMIKFIDTKTGSTSSIDTKENLINLFVSEVDENYCFIFPNYILFRNEEKKILNTGGNSKKYMNENLSLFLVNGSVYDLIGEEVLLTFSEDYKYALFKDNRVFLMFKEKVEIWNLIKRELVKTIIYDDLFSISVHGDRIICSSQSGSITVYDFIKGEVKFSIKDVSRSHISFTTQDDFVVVNRTGIKRFSI